MSLNTKEKPEYGVATASPTPLYDETNVPAPEYRVRTVVRHIVTRYCFPYQSRDNTHGSMGHSETIAEFSSEQRAYDVACAMAKAELGGATVSV
jgi:hypothetical protein